MIDALLFLTRSTIRNRLLLQAKRVRSPRYALALVLGAAYFWLILLRPAVQPARPRAQLWLGAELVATVGILLLLLGGWVFSGEPMALAFSPAELQFLFPAPLTRRGLILYKLFRAQLIILFNAVIWVFVLRRSGSVLAAPLRFLGTWMLFTNLSLHRLGAALVRTSVLEHGHAGVRRHLPAIIVGGASIVALTLVLRDLVHAIRASAESGQVFGAVTNVANMRAARALMFLPRVIVGPSFAQTSAEWFRAAGAALVLLLVQLAWVVRTDVAFEEAAVQASVERARRVDAWRRRSGRPRPTTSKKAKRTLSLAPRGAPASAIVWKNTLLLMRTGRVRSIVGLALMSIVLSMPSIDFWGFGNRFVAVWAVVMSGLLIVLGSRVLQNDFRQDADHLATLKTLPLAGSHLVGAEVISSALPICVLQLVLMLTAYAATLGDADLPMTLATRTALLFMSPLILLAVNVTTVTIQNGAALLFPGWVRATPVVGGGIEAMGQGILATGMLLLTFLVALLPAAAACAATWWLLSGLPKVWIIALTIAAAVLLAETWWGIHGLGRRFERLEPSG